MRPQDKGETGTSCPRHIMCSTGNSPQLLQISISLLTDTSLLYSSGREGVGVANSSQGLGRWLSVRLWRWHGGHGGAWRDGVGVALGLLGLLSMGNDNMKNKKEKRERGLGDIDHVSHRHITHIMLCVSSGPMKIRSVPIRPIYPSLKLRRS